jgi:uncharacterized protein with von Willebrand factor type A (vWA) domain
MYPYGSLPDNLAAFCDGLRRSHRFRIGPGELHDAARALEIVDLTDERAVRNALRPILSANRDDAERFDLAFTRFFIRTAGDRSNDSVAAATLEAGAAGGGSEQRVEVRHRSDPDAVEIDRESEMSSGVITPAGVEEEHDVTNAAFGRSRYSPLEAAAADSPRLAPADPDWIDAARALVRRVHLGLSRRWRPAVRGPRFDLRRTLRSSLQTGGEPMTARWQRRRSRSPRFIILIDGSRSMSAYTRSALQLAVALVGVTPRVEVFTFSTSLHRVTDDARQAAAGATRQLDGLEFAWGGGTTIGACVAAFVRRFGERLLGREAVVIIASDGLDVGDPAALGETMAALRRRSASIVWLNPLIDTPGYEPTASGMSAARASVTTFTSVGDAADLARLARVVRVR